MYNYIFLAIVMISVIFTIIKYNHLVVLRTVVENAWSQIDVQLKRRHDLISGLIDIANTYMQHERETLESVIRARQEVLVISSDKISEKARLESDLSNALQSFNAVAESYPGLKANENFMMVQEEFVSTENRISFARQFYNDSVLNFNNMVLVFPANMIAAMFNIKRAEFFEIKLTEERKSPVARKI